MILKNRIINKKKFFFIFFVIAVSSGWLDPYRDEVSRGNKEYHDKKYIDAKKHYNNAENHAPGEEDKKNLSFNKGNADYMAEEYKSALDYYRKSLQSEDSEVQKKAFFNIGNTYMKLKKNKEAIQSFINALKIDPKYENAKKNIEYILSNKKKMDHKDKNKDNKDKKNQKDKNDKNSKDKKKNKDDKKSEKDKNKENQSEKRTAKKMNREQIKKLLESMKKKPVGIRKGKNNKRGSLEKYW